MLFEVVSRMKLDAEIGHQKQTLRILKLIFVCSQAELP